jgi:hypothetical protein
MSYTKFIKEKGDFLMSDDTRRVNKQPVENVEEYQDMITQRGKTPEELQADLLAGEPDDLSVDFTNVINYYGDGSK